jgi:ABC-type branched-subunit amino acid transport system substrate-binding protein/TolA-binding protein
MRSPLPLASVLALALCACPRPGGGDVRPDGHEGSKPQYTAKQDKTADDALTNAVQVVDTQSKKSGVEALLSVRSAYPETTAAQEALYRAGVLYFESGDFVAARKAFNELLFENPLYEKATDAKLKLGLSALELHAYRDAYQTLSSLAERATGEDRRVALEASARAAAGAQMFGDSLRLAIKAGDDAKTPAEQAAAVDRVTELVEGRVGFLDIAKVKLDLPPSHPAWPVLTFKLARIYYHLRDWQRLEETLQDFLREAPNHPYAVQAKELLARSARRAQVKPKVVGVVLPLKGKYKQLGEAVMRGIGLALKGSDIEVVVKDSEGDVNLAGKQVEELAFDEGAIAIIGPMLNDDSRRAALVAEELQIPLLTLSKAEGITAIGPHVFRNMLTNSQQAHALADYATNTLGYKTFGVLYPNIPFGSEVANAFWDEILARGGTMKAAENYDHDQTTYTTEVKKLVGRFYLDDRSDFIEQFREIRAGDSDAFHKRKQYEKMKSKLDPVVDFEALLIPDAWQRVGLVTPALAAEDVITNACDPRDLEKIKKTTGKTKLKTVTLLGTNTWSSPKGQSGLPTLLERGGKFVQCSVYVDGFFADSERPGTKKFVAAFREAYKDTQPSLLDAVGYDAAGMIRQLIEKSQPRTRDQLTLQLATLKDFDGATGKTSMSDEREAVKPLFFLSIDDKGINEVTPKPAAKGSGT